MRAGGEWCGVRQGRHFSAASSFQIGRIPRPADYFDATCNLAHMPHEQAELKIHPNHRWGRCCSKSTVGLRFSEASIFF
jgi:hypothetical protein